MRTLIISLMSAGLLSTAAWAQDVTLTLWSEQGAEGVEGTFATEFSAMDNGITVEIRQVRFDDLVTETLRAFATGTNPDIIGIDNPDHAAFAARGAFLDLSDRIAASDQIDLDNYFDGPRSSFTWDGDAYGIPRASNTIALYYNKDLFRDAGLDPDSPPEPGTNCTGRPRR